MLSHTMTSRSLTMTAVALMAGALTPGLAQAACTARGNGVVLTVAGAVTNPNRPPFDENTDHFLKYRDHKFDKAHGFTIDALAALPQQSVDGFLPYDHKRHHFDGPALSAVLAAAGGAEFSSITLQALDGYEITLDRPLATADNQVLALCMDSKPLDLGGLGPIYSVIPLADPQAKIDEEAVGRQLWGLMYIGVE